MDSSNKKHIALITTWFPPQQSVATNRMVAFAQYLGEHYKVSVFGMDNRIHTHENYLPNVDVHYSSSDKIHEWLSDKPQDNPLLHKAKVGSRVLLNRFLPSPLKKWKKITFDKLNEIHKIQPFDLIISSYAPIETHQIALDFKKLQKEVPWVADMRDECSSNPFFDEKIRIQLSEIEKEINIYADAITSVSLPLVVNFKKDLPSVKYFLEIRNGFNHDFRRDLNIQKSNDEFHIGYFGIFYGSRKPHFLMHGLDLWREFYPERGVKIHFYGTHQNFQIPRPLQNLIQIHPPLPYQQAIQKMSEMQINLLIHPINGQKGVYTGKLFDYISVQRPVFACVDPADVAAKLILENKAGYVCPFDEPEIIAFQLENAYQDWLNNCQPFANEDFVNSLHRREGVKQLINLIENLTK